MSNIYEICPQFENQKYLLRLVIEDDYTDLLKVYSDVKAVPLFNSDNCGGDDFYYTTESRMTEAIKYWLGNMADRVLSVGQLLIIAKKKL